ncbi:helix-turn-helix domain-containing protein [Bradyrhizobium sp. UNPF46]|uniref:winged helix-turn-helix transcriptional regulator n=1 Tax=Bradyrhizobium sp. UNPF46 TaxID=1141168 RepID=UPI0011503952|nr:helix-turn-helix domain-containing protein [Bradyrhizobium sp. UNPF46]
MTRQVQPPPKPSLSPLDYALQAIGDPWSFLIQQEAFFGVRRFGEFQRNLSIAKNTLTDRLLLLVECGLLEKQKLPDRVDLHEYRLTQRGLNTYPYALMLMKWGDDWLDGEPPVVLSHKTCRSVLHPKAICAACRRELRVEDIRTDLNEITQTVREESASVRVSSRPELYTSGRPTSVSRTLAIIGDRWGFFVLWLALAGVTKFEHFRSVLGIARTTLTSRLNHLVSGGLFERVEYQSRPPRHEYRLTEKGKAVCPVLLTLNQWGLDSRSKNVRAATPLHLSCAQPLRVEVVCDACDTPVRPQDVEVKQVRPVPAVAETAQTHGTTKVAKRAAR